MLSHADFDHYGGLGFLVAELRRRASCGGTASRRHGVRFDAFWRAVRENHVRVAAVRRGLRRVVGGVEVRGARIPGRALRAA